MIYTFIEAISDKLFGVDKVLEFLIFIVIVLLLVGKLGRRKR